MANNLTPKVSIIMATYNRAHFIGEALGSIRNQSYDNWECLVIDDGSTDNTKDILEIYVQKDSRIKFLNRPSNYNKGLPGSRNYGLDLASGEYIIFFDDDDIVHPKNLEYCLEKLEGDDKYFFCRYDKKPFNGSFESRDLEKIIDAKETEVSISDTEKIINGNLPFASCTVMWDRRCFENERFNEELMYSEELELYTRILTAGFKGVSTDAYLYFNRKHPNSNTGEFWNKNPKRINSKVKAMNLVIERLKDKKLLTPFLVKYFLRQGFFLKSRLIIDTVLKASKANQFKTLRYTWGFRFYPYIRPILKLKGKFLMLIKG